MRSLMSRHFALEKAGRLSMRLLLGVSLLLWVPLAVAQSDLGALLDAGAKKLSADEFRNEVVQRVIVGPLNHQGGNLEVMYASNGQVQGIGNSATYPRPSSVNGDWKIDDNGRICMSMHFESTVLPIRCLFWFKQAQQYFLSDSDSDRRAQVLSRTVKQ